MGHQEDRQCREILVRAICARGRKADEQVHTIKAEHLRGAVEEVLGSRTAAHRFEASYEGDHAVLQGDYELQVWVAYARDSDLIRDRVSYRLQVPLQEVGEGVLDRQPQVHVDVLEGPQVVEFGLDKEGNVEVVVGLTFKVSVFGETRLLVQTCRGAGDWPDDLNHDWDWVSQEEMLPSGTRSRQ
ncbi:MAG TPA: outer spore coat protein CotE [Sphingobacteriaceae bacterium]|nr:outer spore coat protein CotE [Sphingobacteriaceae bacterium]